MTERQGQKTERVALSEENYRDNSRTPTSRRGPEGIRMSGRDRPILARPDNRDREGVEIVARELVAWAVLSPRS
jgi:hypothetical protein